MIHKPTAIRLANKWLEKSPKLESLALENKVTSAVVEGAETLAEILEAEHNQQPSKQKRIDLHRARSLVAFVKTNL